MLKTPFVKLKDLISFLKIAPNILLYFFYSILSVHLLFLSLSFLRALYLIDYAVIPHSFFYRFITMTFPPLLWIACTTIETFKFHKFKICAYILVALNEVLILSGILFQLLSRLFLPSIMSIHTDEIFTPGMILFLARLITELPLLLFSVLCFKSLFSTLRQEISRYSLINFKITNPISEKSNTRKIFYHLTISRYIKTGKPIVISEKDRYLHALVD